MNRPRGPGDPGPFFCAFGLSVASNVSDSDTFPAPCGLREGTAQGGSHAPDAGNGPEIHTLRATVGPGTAPAAPGPGHGQPSRRSWTP